MKTLNFYATLGINQGYGHVNENNSTVQIVGVEWQKAAAEIFSENGIYVGAVIKDSKTIYHTDWGCPKGGEATAEIFGTCNPNFTAVEEYKEAVIKCLRKCAIVLGQSTTQVVFMEGDFVYLDFLKKE